MQLPSIPTDNLYKFYFIAGITIMVTAYIIYFNKRDDITRKTNEIETEMIRNILTSNHTLRISIAQKDKTNDMLNEIMSNATEDESTMLSTDSLNKIREKIRIDDLSVEEKKSMIQSDSSFTDYKERLVKQEKKQFAGLTFIWGIFFVFGFCLTLYGHSRWDDHVQQPLNERTQLELEILQLDLAKRRREEAAFNPPVPPAS